MAVGDWSSVLINHSHTKYINTRINKTTRITTIIFKKLEVLDFRTTTGPGSAFSLNAESGISAPAGLLYNSSFLIGSNVYLDILCF